jgi:hypothetical protein
MTCKRFKVRKSKRSGAFEITELLTINQQCEAQNQKTQVMRFDHFTCVFSEPGYATGSDFFSAFAGWFSGRNERTVFPACHISLSRNSFNSASSFSR